MASSVLMVEAGAARTPAASAAATKEVLKEIMVSEKRFIQRMCV